MIHNSGFEFQQLILSLKYVIILIMGIRDTGVTKETERK
jgi:hypothetical protein